MQFYTFMTHSVFELHLITLFEINLLIDVEIQLGKTIYVYQGFQIQGTHIWS